MSSLKDKIVREIRDLNSCSSASFELAAHFIEKGLGQVANELWPVELVESDVDDEDVRDVSGAIVYLIQSNASDQLKASAIWAIGKTRDKKFKSVYIDVIKEYDSIENVLLYQALIALGEIEPLPSEGGSMSLFDADGNKLLARKYLEQNSGEM